MSLAKLGNLEVDLADQVSEFYDDPLGFVLWAFDWNEGDLEGFDGPDQWQVDLLSDLGEQVDDRDFNGVDPVDPIQYAIASGHGIGKGSPCSTVVSVPVTMMDSYGNIGVTKMMNKKWGSLKVGDYVFGGNGKPTKITATNRYRRIHYKVTFDDGSSSVVSGEHEWNVRGRQERRNKLDTWRTMETVEILEDGVKRPNGTTTARQWEIPIQGAAEFDTANGLPLDPYIMGLWLSDGNGSRISKKSEAVRDKIRQHHHSKVSEYKCGRSVGILNVDWSSEPVFKCRSWEKYIPDSYKYASVEQRINLFNGFMDGDGEVNKSGSCGYSTTSKQLLNDVIWLARSLGYKASKQPTTKYPSYTYKGEKKQGRPCYRVAINTDTNPFTHEDRKAAWKASEHRYIARWIDSIEPVGLMDGMCIEVEAEDQLYLTNDFIVTHNSALTAWLILWIMSTRPHCKGIVTANTSDQLRTKTWGELGKWKKRCITGHWFEWNNGRGSMNIYHLEFPESWRVDAQTCREENSESFAGLHNAGSTPFYIFDEASAVPDKIWEVAEGGKTDGEPMHFVFGNPTRNGGMFHKCFHGQKHRWVNKQIDSRSAKMTNKTQIKKWAEDWGEDSDFFRVRVLGRFPKASDMQFIPNDIVSSAAGRRIESLGDDPLICGVDVARGGSDNNMIQFRRGFDAYSEKTYRIPGEKTRDSMVLVSKLTDIFDRHKPHVIFLDETGLGGPIVDRLIQLGYPVQGINFGSKAINEKLYCNMSAEMWAKMRQWLFAGGCIKNHPELESELTGRLYDHNERNQLVLERKKDMKSRGMASPDWGDALSLTFARPVAPLVIDHNGQMSAGGSLIQLDNDYDPLGD